MHACTVIDMHLQSFNVPFNHTSQFLTILQRKNWDSPAKMFNCTIYPRDYVHGNAIEYVYLFRCASMPQRYFVDRKIPSTKNHFVALCQPLKALQPGEHYFKPHLPTLLLSAKPVHCKVAPMPTSTQVTAVNLYVSTKKESVKPVHPDFLHAAPSSTRTTSIISTKIYINHLY